jgi:plastocyanin
MADARIGDLTEDTNPSNTDLIETEKDPGGTPVSRKVTFANVTKALSVMTGDAGSGGAKGLVGAPAAGDGAAGKFWKADGTWGIPPGTGPSSTEAVQDIVGAMVSDTTSIDATYDDGAGTLALDLKADAPPLSPATVTLTDGATITWATAGARQNNAKVTLGGNRTLDITSEVDGATGTLYVKQDATGSRTLTLPAGSKVINNGSGAVTLSTGANKTDILTWIYDGANFFWTIGKDYS